MKVYKFLGAGLLVAFISGAAFAQGPRPTTASETASKSTGVSVPKPAPAPQTFKAKYEGGIFGYNKKQDGTLSVKGERFWGLSELETVPSHDFR